MLVDHAREFVFIHAQVSDPMNVETTSPALFFTRLSAHLCAPVFVALTGLGAWLYGNKQAGGGNGASAASAFLLKRGLFLVVLELTVVNFAWTFQFGPELIYLQVIWAIGLSMIALAALVHLPRPVLIVVGMVVVLGHNLLDPITVAAGQPGHAIWAVLHDRGFIDLPWGGQARTSYPLLPWIGVIVLGYVAGPWYARTADSARRRSLLVTAGVAALAVLLVLRGLNIYGETLDWTAGETALRTVMSFLNVTKYPPSLAFLLLTLGVGLVVLGWLEQRDNLFLRVCASFGGAPMFYYLLHLFLLLGLQKLAVAAFGANDGSRYEFDHLWQVWLLSAALIPLLYWPCKAFAAFKRRTSMGWVRYL